jgi:uncharacterized membrane protein YhaH (DUF805 family)
MTAAPPPGWYPDPSAPGTQRYWDGAAWTESVSPMPGYVAPAPPPTDPSAAAAFPAAPAGYATPQSGYRMATYQPSPQVSFVEAIKLGFRKYGTFAGRATRAEYWWWYLFSILIFFPLYVVFLIVTVAVAGTTSTTSLDGTTSVSTTTTSAGGSAAVLIVALLMLIVGLALFIPSLSVMVRRLHDTDRSGWWYWISLVPFVGGIILLVFLVSESSPGPNQFGPPSRGAADLA